MSQLSVVLHQVNHMRLDFRLFHILLNEASFSIIFFQRGHLMLKGEPH